MSLYDKIINKIKNIQRLYYMLFKPRNLLWFNSDSGFFSNCSTILKEIVNYYNNNHEYPIVNYSSEWSRYKDRPFQNVSKLFFHQLPITKAFDCIKIIESEHEDQFSDYSKLNFEALNFLVKKYFSLSSNVVGVIETLEAKYNIEYQNTIAILFRGNDKCKETNLPSYQEIIEKTKEILKIYPNKKILLQSDELEFYESMLKEFPNAIYFDEIMKINANNNKQIASEVKKGSKASQGIIFLAIMNIISRSDIVILNSGNVGLWLCLFRGNIKNVIQYLNPKEYIYGIKQRNYIKPDSYWITN